MIDAAALIFPDSQKNMGNDYPINSITYADSRNIRLC